jgi:ribokinase
MATNRAGVAVVGSYGVGVWITTPRLPAEGETVLGSDFGMGPGGKGSNQAIGIARLGAPVQLLACVGADTLGDDALALWDREGVDRSHVLRRSARSTMVGFIILDSHGKNRIIIDPGANALLTPADVEAFGAVIRASPVVLTQLEIPIPTAAATLALGRQAGATTILNPAPAQPLPADVLANVDVLVPNQTEARILAGLAPDDPRPDRDVAALLFQLGVKTVVVTLGENGALVVTPGGTIHLPGHSVPVVDTTGAGDGFNAGLATALLEGREIADAVALANRVGAWVVTRSGVVPALPHRADIDATPFVPMAS